MPKLSNFNISFNLPAVQEQTDYLRYLVESSITAAVQAGAQVIYNEVKGRAAGFADTGNLSRAIYQWRNKDEQRPGHAEYRISWRKGRGKTKLGAAQSDEQKAAAGLPIASHGVLVEYGYIQRYASYEKNGKWYTAVRPEMRGKPAPKRRAPQSVKDAYFVLRKGGPVQVLPRSFLRAGYEASKVRAVEAARLEMTRRINAKLL